MGRARYRRQPRRLRTIVTATAVLGALGLLATGRVVGSTFAAFDAATVNANNAFADGSLTVPSALQARVSGTSVNLSWTAGANGNQYDVLGYDAGQSSTCASPGSSSYAQVASAAATATTYAASPGAPNGDWYCYEVENAFGTSWTSVNDGTASGNTNPTVAVQTGFVATTVGLANGASTTGCATGTSGQTNRLDCGDQVVLTFNQQPTTTATIAGVCLTGTTSYTLLLGVSSCGGAPTIGSLAASGGTATGTGVFYPATGTWSTAAPWTLTITVQAPSGTNPTYTTFTAAPTSWTLSAASTLASSVGTVAICTTVAPTCQPTTTTDF